MALNKEQWLKAMSAIETIEQADTAEEVFARVRDYTTGLGGQSILIGRIVNPILSGRPISEFGMSDWDEDYLKDWVEKDLVLHDPITQYALKSRSTFDWQTAKDHGSRFGKRILDRGRDVGMDQGVAIPVTVGHLPLGIVSIGLEEELNPEHLKMLELVAIHTYTHLLSFMSTDEVAPMIKLTPRELDILTFTAAGKTSWEISKIYGIADSTVKTHLQNIIRKTDAANKTHAVTQAIRNGQIMP